MELGWAAREKCVMDEWMDGYDHPHELQISFHGFTKFSNSEL